ncbi:Si-specific NAD(P)(+) transhydrogenase [Kozakia baliensis]|uniref:Soluble pyridine nucleotide transhydrogenase n=1 Tax=Kozakia baliensis TaxID=153496 RepID=A0A1D8UQC5_9PROT|nr:Si-specific NAD(P)(+) transhydrogenase [Kozakia baliensis]AOX15829.1 NAD(P)(+) transhydrogenase [Kozakia baliensis]GBR24318.1 dihydrolipoamide dehydrogenase [Kozakia baliensis NRIC 0488]GEL64554.1 NAD(P)(+) transhydrogenase [Kozakia baliensis]
MADIYDYDLVVIGSGPSGKRAAVQAAKFGRSVLIVDKGAQVGGVSVHTGTIPSKTLRETVLNLTGWRERGFYGLAYRVKHDISVADLHVRLEKTLEYEVNVLEHQFVRNQVTVQQGLARFVDPHQIEVLTGAGESHVVSADKVIIAVGTKPHRPSHIPFDDKVVIDSDGITRIERLPRSLTVVGGGVIGIEYATIFSALDVRVTIVEPRETILDFVDRELVADFMHQLRDRGVNFRLGTQLESIQFELGQPVAILEGGRRVRSDMLLYTAGRTGSTDQLNLEACGLQADGRGRLKVDPKTFQTATPNIYATGDVIGFPSLASTSMEQGRIAACHAFQQKVPNAPEFFPYGIYSVPEISTVGLSEEQARAEGIPYECGIARFKETARGNIMGLQGGMLKLIISLETRKLLGVHIVGEGATELIHIGQAVINLDGAFDYFIDATFNYPTLAEAYKIAALDAWNRITPRVLDEGNDNIQPQEERSDTTVAEIN